jgi:hypothetical protein
MLSDAGIAPYNRLDTGPHVYPRMQREPDPIAGQGRRPTSNAIVLAWCLALQEVEKQGLCKASQCTLEVGEGATEKWAETGALGHTIRPEKGWLPSKMLKNNAP